MQELHTQAPDGKQHTFYWRVEESTCGGKRCWIYRVHRTKSPDPKEDFYEATVVELDAGRVYTDVISNNGQRWAMGKGITEALFEVITVDLGRTLVSSRPNVVGEAEWQTEDANRMWERFVQQGRAAYNKEEQRYQYIPKGHS